ncbi:MAG: apolipoprotein N-acyltransferase [Azoarcus sp.]|jgi:apolipoprotein N-acyltransferase|nr:apolipoprotein N-acyltransferase [Azoarcus sp.]
MKVFLLAFFVGALAVAAFAPLGWFPLAFVSLAVLVAALERAFQMRVGFALGFAWGLGAFLAGISWLYITMERYSGLHPVLSAIAILGFSAYLALYPALVGMVYVRFAHGGALRRATFFAALWLLGEWLRGTLFTGFPWLAIGYSQTPPSPLAGFFAIVGVYGVGALTAFVAALLALGAAEFRAARARLALPAVAMLCVFVVGYGLSLRAWVEPDGEPLAVSLLQPNVDPLFKWNPENFDAVLRINAKLVEQSRGEVVVLPETAIAAPMDWLPGGYLEYLTGLVAKRDATVVTGFFAQENGQFENAAISLGAQAGQTYAKRHLVPFGEYAPPLFVWLYKMLNIPMSDLHPGAKDQPPLLLKGRRIAVNICYEDLFGVELTDSLPQAGLMLNISNLAWYGDSLAQPQHLQIARARALELGRPMLRSTNTGMTALVLPDGKVEAVLPAFERGVLEVSVAAYRGETPYGRWGDLPELAAALAVVVVLLGIRKAFPARNVA